VACLCGGQRPRPSHRRTTLTRLLVTGFPLVHISQPHYGVPEIGLPGTNLNWSQLSSMILAEEALLPFDRLLPTQTQSLQKLALPTTRSVLDAHVPGSAMCKWRRDRLSEVKRALRGKLHMAEWLLSGG